MTYDIGNRAAAVEIIRTTPDTALRVLIGIVAFLHAVTCMVFLYTVYTMYQALAAMQDSMQQWGSLLGGGN